MPAAVYVALYAPAFWFAIAITAIILLALYEYNAITAPPARDRLFDAVFFLSGASVPVVFYAYPGYRSEICAGVVILISFFALLGDRELKHVFPDAAVKLYGVAYVALPFSYLILIKQTRSGGKWLFFLLVTIWLNDTFALFVGKAFGRHRLCPLISPNKTVEGAIGGIVAGVAGALIFQRFYFSAMMQSWAGILAFVIGIVGIIGDLVESVIKRACGVKDSGTMIPGHGGMLDRIDSLIFAAPVLYYFLIWIYLA